MKQQVDYARDMSRPEAKHALYEKALYEIQLRFPRLSRQRQRREAKRIHDEHEPIPAH